MHIHVQYMMEICCSINKTVSVGLCIWSRWRLGRMSISVSLIHCHISSISCDDSSWKYVFSCIMNTGIRIYVRRYYHTSINASDLSVRNTKLLVSSHMMNCKKIAMRIGVCFVYSVNSMLSVMHTTAQRKSLYCIFSVVPLLTYNNNVHLMQP